MFKPAKFIKLQLIGVVFGRQRVGAKIQCNNCYTAYHPLCARMAGLYMNMVDASDGQDEGAVRLISYCPKHCTPHPELAGDLSNLAHPNCMLPIGLS